MTALERAIKTAKAAVDTVTNFFDPHDEHVADFEATTAQLEAEEQALGQRLAAAEAEVKKWKEDLPETRLAALRDEAGALTNRRDSILNAKKNRLTEHLTDDHADFKALVDRLAATVRATRPPSVWEVFNRIEGTSSIGNADELKRYATAAHGPLLDPTDPWSPRLPSALRQAQAACAQLWRLPLEAQRTEIAKHRAAIKESFRGTVFEHELEG